MATVKGVNRSATVALAPDAPYMAAGTMAGAVDLSFSSSATLEIFKLDFQSEDKELPVVGESQSSERFNRLSWGKNVLGSEKFALGLVAGGLVDGSIDIWNPLSLIRPTPGENAIVGHLSKHKGPVRGLEFNGIAPNLLASGADDGEICIWDFANPAEPIHFPPLKGSGSADRGEISFLSWNSKVQHILASTSYNGTTVVWDLKKQKPVISFSDSIRRRCSVLQWNPDIATQLVVASDDDSSPLLKLWDMRNTMSPVKEFTGHTKGVIAMSWCPFDSSYLLTCSKDNRTICWDTATGEIVRELPAGNNWNFDVHWYSRIPGIISASSFDGKVGIYNIEGCSRFGSGESDFIGESLKAPKWYKRPAGVSFGFGGKLVTFHSKSSAAGTSVSASEVHVHNVITEHGLVCRSSEFESAIQNGERSSLRALCETKSKESEYVFSRPGRSGDELQYAPQIGEENQPQKSKRKTRWSDAANLLLISGWLSTSKDSIVGIDQTSTRFWQRIADYFNENCEDGHSRTESQCKDHWNKINPKVLLFNGCYQRVRRARQNGWSDDQIMDHARQLYKSENGGSHFLFDYCWKLLKNEPKWNTSYQQEGLKRTKVSESGAYTSSSNPEKSDDEVHEMRPFGLKAAKKMGKGKEKKEKKEESAEYLEIQTRKAAALEKLVEIEAKKAEDKRITKYMDYLIMDTSYMTNQQKKDHEKFCYHIRTNILKF